MKHANGCAGVMPGHWGRFIYRTVTQDNGVMTQCCFHNNWPFVTGIQWSLIECDAVIWGVWRPCDVRIMDVQRSLRWRHKRHDSVSDHQPHDCLPNRLFRCRSKKTSQLYVTGLCMGNSPVIGEFLGQKASNAESVFIWWRHHGCQN